jgi:AcrR family transcriptional regulator
MIKTKAPLVVHGGRALPGQNVEPGAKAQQTRQRILDAALNLFRENGFDRTTMRDIASAAGVANGAAYYYFRSKEELVMAFYLRTADESRVVLPAMLAKTRDLRKRLHIVIEQKLEQFVDHRAFIGALFRTAIDPASPLSPFGKETAPIREEATDRFRIALEGSSVAVPREFRAKLPHLLWLYQMGIILFWVYDKSPGQQRTHRLVAGTIDLMVHGLRLASLPLLGPIRRKVSSILNDLEVTG